MLRAAQTWHVRFSSRARHSCCCASGVVGEKTVARRTPCSPLARRSESSLSLSLSPAKSLPVRPRVFPSSPSWLLSRQVGPAAPFLPRGLQSPWRGTWSSFMPQNRCTRFSSSQECGSPSLLKTGSFLQSLPSVLLPQRRSHCSPTNNPFFHSS